MNKSQNPRLAAVQSLTRSEKDSRYTNLEVNAELRRDKFRSDNSDRAFFTALVYGVAERKITLDYIIENISSRPLCEIDTETANIIRIGLYQIIYMDKIPNHAAVSECVNIAQTRSKGFVNAVLREYLRRGDKIKLPDEKYENWSVKYSAPVWLCRMWDMQYGCENAQKLLESTIRPPRLCLRVNTLKISADELLSRLIKLNYDAKLSEIADDMIIINGNAAVSELYGIDSGLFFIEDESSRLCVSALGAREGEFIIDACAAPGGKSFSAAVDMKNQGKILSCDIHKNKLNLISGTADKLGITIINAELRDARLNCPELIENADRVLCDVPCSGLGVISKKPDIRYKSPDDIEGLGSVQSTIIENCASYVKSGGVLVYSTCTLNKSENEDIVREFLARHSEFEPVEFAFGELTSEGGMLTLFPHITETDGFFIAKMVKKDK